jgi:hypothetical protein
MQGATGVLGMILTAVPMRHLQEAAEAVRQNLNLTQFDEAAVRQLAEFIENERPNVSADSRAAVVNALGCFLGECIIRSFGGWWRADTRGTAGIQIGQNLFLHPHFFIEQQFKRGIAESVAEFFASLPTRLLNPPPPRRTWIPVPVPVVRRPM